MPKPYPQEFRDDVVRVTLNREAGVTFEQIAVDFGVHPVTLSKWMRQADIDAGVEPGPPRVSLPSCENCAAAIVCWSGRTRSCATWHRICPKLIYGERLYPLVKEPAADGIPVPGTAARSPTLLPLTRCSGDRCRSVSGRRLVRRPSRRPEFGYRFLADEARDAGEAMGERTA